MSRFNNLASVIKEEKKVRITKEVKIPFIANCMEFYIYRTSKRTDFNGLLQLRNKFIKRIEYEFIKSTEYNYNIKINYFISKYN